MCSTEGLFLPIAEAYAKLPSAEVSTYERAFGSKYAGGFDVGHPLLVRSELSSVRP